MPPRSNDVVPLSCLQDASGCRSNDAALKQCIMKLLVDNTRVGTRGKFKFSIFVQIDYGLLAVPDPRDSPT